MRRYPANRGVMTLDTLKAAVGLLKEVAKSDLQIARIALGVPPKQTPAERENDRILREEWGE